MQEPILHYYNKYGVDINRIEEIVYGDKYLAVLLKDGSIGVCATLLGNVKTTLTELDNFDVTSYAHRIFAIAYFNALLNNKADYSKQVDIFNKIDFRKYSNIVMIGFFGSLAEKFKRSSIDLSIFDFKSKNPDLVDMKRQKEYLAKADFVILTSTSIINNTFLDIVNSTSHNCRIATLGPSTILDADMFQYKNVHLLFGSLFEKNDLNLLNIIRNDGGTKSFLHLINKVCFENQKNEEIKPTIN